MNFSAIRNAFRLGPKTLDQATGNLDAAAATLDSVNALFVAAGLNLETMLATGPDALKAHIASLSAKDGELAVAQAKVTDLEGKLSIANQTNATLTASNASTVSILTSIGFTPVPNATEADAKKAFDAHVKKEAALELAKTGHRPVADVPPATPGNAQAIDPKLTGLARVEAAFKAKAAK